MFSSLSRIKSYYIRPNLEFESLIFTDFERNRPPCSCPNILRQVLTGKRRTCHHQIRGGAFEDDQSPIMSGAGPRSTIQSAWAMTA